MNLDKRADGASPAGSGVGAGDGLLLASAENARLRKARHTVQANFVFMGRNQEKNLFRECITASGLQNEFL
jgi:hypothetical protein